MNNSINVIKHQNIVQDYLNKFRVSSDSEYTHVSMGENFYGKFMLDKHQIKEFTKLYSEAVECGVVFSIAENPKD